MRKITLIVEGTNDEDRVKEALANAPIEVNFIVTNGTRFSRRVRLEVEGYLQSGSRVFILSDPDEGGNQMARPFIMNYRLRRIEVDPTQARKAEKRGYSRLQTWKYGIEYCDPSYLHDLIMKFIEEDDKWRFQRVQNSRLK